MLGVDCIFDTTSGVPVHATDAPKVYVVTTGTAMLHVAHGDEVTEYHMVNGGPVVVPARALHAISSLNSCTFIVTLITRTTPTTLGAHDANDLIEKTKK